MSWFKFSKYDFKKEPEDSYPKMYNEAYKLHKDEYFKRIYHWNWFVPHVPFEGIEFVHEWQSTHIVFCGTENLYWIFFRQSPRWDERGKWKFKLMKCSNDHTSCG